MLKYIYTFFLLVSLRNAAYAQDPQFSQFYANPVYTNPAFAGSARGTRIVMIGRDQYTSLARNYKTAAASVDGNIKSLNGGLGLMAMTDVAGDGFLTNTVISGVYSYHIALSRTVSLRAGIKGSYVQKSYDFSKFKFGDMIDDRLGFVNPTAETVGSQIIRFMNFSTGFIVYSDQIFGGFAVDNMVEPNQSFYNLSGDQFNLPRRYTAHMGTNIYVTHERDVRDRIYISPNVMYMQQRNFNQLNLGFYVRKQTLILGGWFRQTSRNTDAIIALIGLKFDHYRVGYSFDATVSGARTATTGSHEISLAIEFKVAKNDPGRRAPKAIKCPEL